MALQEWIKGKDRQQLKGELLAFKSSLAWQALQEFLEYESLQHRGLMYDCLQRGETHQAASEAAKDLALQYVKGRFLDLWIANLDGKEMVQEEVRPEE